MRELTLRLPTFRWAPALSWRPFDVARRRPYLPSLLVDVAAIALAVLDVWLVTPKDAQPYSAVLSWLACAALLGRRRFPFLTMVATFPGFLAGWSELAGMIALGFLAHRRGMHWQTWTGAALVVLGRVMVWPPSAMLGLDLGEHVKNLLYAPVVAGMPVAIGLLVLARKDLARKYDELGASREEQRKMQARAVRADERNRIAREMHDVVSHDVTLIAMQANALEVARTPEEAQRAAETIRQLSNRTLEELRSLVGVLRSGSNPDSPGLDNLDELIRSADVNVDLQIERCPAAVPTQVSSAAYRTVQEALTNVCKHAPGARATVMVRHEDDALHVEVRNGRPETTCDPGLPSGGHGLTGLAERASLLDGEFRSGATSDGGFAIAATYPIGA